MAEQRAHPLAGRAQAAIAAVALILTMAACTGGAGGTTPSSPPDGTGASASSAAVTGSQETGRPQSAASCANPAGSEVGSIGGPLASALGAALCGMADINPCSMLKASDVQALFSVPLASPTTDHLGTCTWPLSDPSKGDGLDVFAHAGGDMSIQNDIDFSTSKPLAGIGDQAVWELLAGYFPHIGAIEGQDTCELTIGGGDGQLSVHTTGSGVFAAIDATALPGFLSQLGALCNQVFAGLGATKGSGATLPVGSSAPAASAAAPSPAVGHLGDQLTYSKYGGDQVQATLVKVFDPAIPNKASEAPLPAATHWVGVEAIVDNKTDYAAEGSTFDAVISSGATVTTTVTNDGSYTLGDGFQGCTQTDGNPQDTETYTFCLAFPVPDGQTLTQVGVRTGGGELGMGLVTADQAHWLVP